MKSYQGNQHLRHHVYDRSRSRSLSNNITGPPAHTVRTHSDYEQRPHYLLPKKTISKFDPAKQHRQEQRYHYHSDRDISASSTSSAKVFCYICKKRYPSSKFLYAHMMRFHPEKGMKGVLPQQKAPSTIKSSDERSTTKGLPQPPRALLRTHVSPSRSQSSFASDVTEPNLDCDPVPVKVLLSWGQKDRRGRTSICPSNHAVTSGQQNPNETVEETKSSTALIIPSQQKRTYKNSSTSTDDDIDNVKLVTKMSMMMTLMKKYECNICHKEFESGQALGGHKSSSSCRAAGRGLMKLEASAPLDDDDDDHGGKLGVLATMATMIAGELEEGEIVEDGDITDEEGIRSLKVHDFDLNELPPEAKDEDI